MNDRNGSDADVEASTERVAAVSGETLSAEVGGRLRERREALKMSLRDAAHAADVSAGHLSEIETGQSLASLPVLLRLGRVLNYPMAELLPRIGGHRIRESSLVGAAGAKELSHPELDLHVVGITLEANDRIVHEIDSSQDVSFYVVSGTCLLVVGSRSYELDAGDSADIQMAQDCDVIATSDLVAVFIEARRP